MHIEKTAE